MFNEENVFLTCLDLSYASSDSLANGIIIYRTYMLKLRRQNVRYALAHQIEKKNYIPDIPKLSYSFVPTQSLSSLRAKVNITFCFSGGYYWTAQIQLRNCSGWYTSCSPRNSAERRCTSSGTSRPDTPTASKSGVGTTTLS